jgi:hypothetical protein
VSIDLQGYSCVVVALVEESLDELVVVTVFVVVVVVVPSCRWSGRGSPAAREFSSVFAPGPISAETQNAVVNIIA